jgi:sugar lactone lactonase YvrE
MTFTVVPVPEMGAEDVVVATSGPDEGAVFTGTGDGAIWRVGHDGSKVDQVANTGGRPLGIEIDLDGRLMVCDARKGLLRVDPRSGGVEAVEDSVAGQKMVFCNNGAVASDGTIWWSDSSTKFGIDNWKDDFVQDTRTGRLLRRDPDGSVTVVLDGLRFANGVTLNTGEDFVVVAECAGRTLVRYWIKGERAGQRDYLVDDLPGYPDNIARGSDGLIWTTIATPRDPLVERIQAGPQWLRRQITKIPEKLQPKPKQTIRVQAYDDAGTLVHDVDVKEPGFHMVTGVREHDGRVWMGSLHENAVAVVDL